MRTICPKPTHLYPPRTPRTPRIVNQLNADPTRAQPPTNLPTYNTIIISPTTTSLTAICPMTIYTTFMVLSIYSPNPLPLLSSSNLPMPLLFNPLISLITYAYNYATVYFGFL